MKALFLPLGIVAAITLWYSNAHADQTRHFRAQPSAHHVQSVNAPRGNAWGHQNFGHQNPVRRDVGHRDFGRDNYGQRSHAYQNRGDHGWGGRGADSRHDGRWQYANNRAQGYRDGVNGRQAEQRQRIALASRAGTLSRDERSALRNEQRSIAAEERRYLADGRLSRDERRDLNKDLSLASRHIYNESHDTDRRGDLRPDRGTSRNFPYPVRR